MPTVKAELCFHTTDKRTPIEDFTVREVFFRVSTLCDGATGTASFCVEEQMAVIECPSNVIRAKNLANCANSRRGWPSEQMPLT